LLKAPPYVPNRRFLFVRDDRKSGGDERAKLEVVLERKEDEETVGRKQQGNRGYIRDKNIAKAKTRENVQERDKR